MLVFFQLAQFTAIAMIGAFFNADPTRWMYLDVHSAPASVELLLLWGMFGELLFAASGLRRDVVLHDEKTESRVTRFLKKQPRKVSAFPAAFLHPFFGRIFRKSKIMSTVIF